MALTLKEIHAAARASRIKWRYHALLRAQERGISRQQALRVIHEGEIIEQRPRAKPFPKCLLMAMVEPGRPLYVSLGYDASRKYLYIITVHWLDPRKWDDAWTRKPKTPKLKEDKNYYDQNPPEKRSLRALRRTPPLHHHYPRGAAGT